MGNILKKTAKKQGVSPVKTVKCNVWSKELKKFLTVREWKRMRESGVVGRIELKPKNPRFNA